MESYTCLQTILFVKQYAVRYPVILALHNLKSFCDLFFNCVIMCCPVATTTLLLLSLREQDARIVFGVLLICTMLG